MSLISLPFFKTDKTEKLEAADAYDITSSAPINKVYNAAKEGATKLYDQVGGRQGVMTGIQNLITAKKSGANGKQLLEAGLGMFGTSTMGILKTAGNGIFDKAATFIDLSPETVGKIKSTGSQLYSRLEYGDPSDLSNYGDLTTLMGDLSGHPEWATNVNIGLESAVWGSAISKTVEYGQYNYISDAKQYTDPEVYQQALVYSVPAVASSGSLEAIKSLNAEMASGTIMANKPDFVKTFLQQFKMPAEITITREAYAVEVVNTLNAIAGPWYTYHRQDGEDIIDLSMLAIASEPARQLFELHPVLSVYAIASRNVVELSVEDVIRSQFPMMVTSLS